MLLRFYISFSAKKDLVIHVLKQTDFTASLQIVYVSSAVLDDILSYCFLYFAFLYVKQRQTNYPKRY